MTTNVLDHLQILRDAVAEAQLQDGEVVSYQSRSDGFSVWTPKLDEADFERLTEAFVHAETLTVSAHPGRRMIRVWTENPPEIEED